MTIVIVQQQLTGSSCINAVSFPANTDSRLSKLEQRRGDKRTCDSFYKISDTQRSPDDVA
ncbi:Inositol phosphosphingolipids phospholipase C [Clarias magur]|uniref:Inositol phosphosphingolipids phospholipase C n=1 Tax=Clarias magur TaxID=1594786 RepID=A0A8J4U536_CLAMG|nr:Inositol phosphosphingolipids phospholipase C [Clarias magur]